MIRMKFLRIRPATWAITSPPTSRATRNCVLASASVTRPSTSIDSSFAMTNFRLLPVADRPETRTRSADADRVRLRPISHYRELVPPAAVAVPAAAPAAPTAAVPAAAPAVSAAATTARPRLAGPGLVHRQRPALEVEVVERLDRRLGLGLVRHLDEPEAAGPAGLPVQDHLGPGHRPVLAEQLHQVVVRATPREVAHIDIHHRHTFSEAVGLRRPTPVPRHTGHAGRAPNQENGFVRGPGRAPLRLWALSGRGGHTRRKRDGSWARSTEGFSRRPT